MTAWIQTFTGIAFDLLRPRVEDIAIADIAHALSLQCRFNGHVRGLYSVADHSLRVAKLCTGEARLFGLLHDAGEAYVGDIVRPLKHAIGWEVVERTERRIRNVVFERFAGRYPDPEEWGAVKLADCVLLATEARDLMGPAPRPWEHLPPPLPETLYPHGPPSAVEEDFLAAFEEYGGKP